MEDQGMLKNFFELVGLPVASRQERLIADALISKLQALGLDVVEEDTAAVTGGNAGNIRARLVGDPHIEPVLLSAHMDRVANNGHITPCWEEGDSLIQADGKTILAADDVSGICIILEVLRNVTTRHIPHGDIEVAFSVCEEAGVLGSRHFDFSQFKSKVAFVFDSPGQVGRIVCQAPSKGKITIRVHGREAHAGNEPEKGLNALRIAADILMHLPDGRLSPETTMNFSILHGGSSTNVVCGLAELIGEQRSTNEREYAANAERVQAVVQQIAAKYGTTIDVDIETLYRAFKVEPEEMAARIAARAFSNLGITPQFERGGGGMDANHFNARGIQSVGIACGYAKNHTPHESLSVADFLKCGEAATELIRVMARREY
jgi:tripeptide aminopeptidase